MRNITYAAAIHEALDQLLSKHENALLIGEGVPDPRGIFGTTVGLQKKYGTNRVMDMPVSENAVTGICIGAALSGLRPIMTHQRMDFTLLAFDQIINNAAKWYYMFGGQTSVPLVIRMIIGRGWGQGAQHSQSLQALYAHIPGLKVVMPATSMDAKGMLIASFEDNNPIIFIEHRWLHNTTGAVPQKYYRTNLNSVQTLQKGSDITIVSTSYMVIESMRAAHILTSMGISAEIVDIRCLKPLDTTDIINSVIKTQRLLVADTGYESFGIASEVIAKTSMDPRIQLHCSPQSITLSDIPTTTSWAEAKDYYPTYLDITATVATMLKKPKKITQKILEEERAKNTIPSDIPDPTFTGPF